jgi:anti-sigma factor RsiW
MGCEIIEERLCSHLDGVLNAQEGEEVAAHLEACVACYARWKSMGDVQAKLRRLERPRIPVVLAVQLRVLASHEHARRLARASFAARLRNWKETVVLHFENMMSPVALPLAGGVLSALLLFCALIPTLIFRHQVTNDPPVYFTAPDGQLVNWIGEVPRLEPVDAVVSSDENVLELTIDSEGHVFDYTVRQGQLTPEMVTIIQFSRLTPAMFFGRPAWGKTLVVLPARRHTARG